MELFGVSLFGLLSWWTWAVGALGIAGAVALAVVAIGGAPMLAAMLGQRVAALIAEFLATTLGLAIVVGLCAWFASAMLTGQRAASECAARLDHIKRAALEERERLAALAAQQQAEAERRAAEELAAQAKESQQVIHALQQQIETSRPGPDALYDALCRATPAGVRAFTGGGAAGKK